MHVGSLANPFLSFHLVPLPSPALVAVPPVHVSASLLFGSLDAIFDYSQSDTYPKLWSEERESLVESRGLP